MGIITELLLGINEIILVKFGRVSAHKLFIHVNDYLFRVISQGTIGSYGDHKNSFRKEGNLHRREAGSEQQRGANTEPRDQQRLENEACEKQGTWRRQAG